MDQHNSTYITNEDDESEISLMHLMYYVLRHWRSLLAGAMVFCIMLGGFKLVKGLGALGSVDLKKDQQTYERALNEYTISKDRLEKQAEELTRALENQGKYHDESILMNLDPETAYKSTLTYVVNDISDLHSVPNDAESIFAVNRKINSVVGAYVSLIQNGSILRDVQNELGSKMDQKYLAELVYVQADYQSKLIHITILGKNQDEIEALSDAVNRGIQSASEDLMNAVGAHRLQLISSYVGSYAGTSIQVGSIPEDGANSKDATYQTSIESLQKGYTETLTELQGQLTDCNEQLDELEEPTAPEGISRKSVLKEAVKYGVIGFIGGMFLIALVYMMQYIFGGKLMDCDELNDRYGILLLGDYHAPINAHPNAVDKCLARINGITEEKQNLENAYTLGTAHIIAQLGASETAGILLVGNAKVKDFESASSALSERLRPAGIEVTVAGNVNECASAIEKLKETEQVVLIEQCGVSRQQDIQKELLILRKLGKEIVGAIVL